MAGEEGVAVLAACNGVGEGASLTPQVISLLNKQATADVPVAVNHCPFDDDDGEFASRAEVPNPFSPEYEEAVAEYYRRLSRSED